MLHRAEARTPDHPRAGLAASDQDRPGRRPVDPECFSWAAVVTCFSPRLHRRMLLAPAMTSASTRRHTLPALTSKSRLAAQLSRPPWLAWECRPGGWRPTSLCHKSRPARGLGITDLAGGSSSRGALVNQRTSLGWRWIFATGIARPCAGQPVPRLGITVGDLPRQQRYLRAAPAALLKPQSTDSSGGTALFGFHPRTEKGTAVGRIA